MRFLDFCCEYSYNHFATFRDNTILALLIPAVNEFSLEMRYFSPLLSIPQYIQEAR